MLILHSVWIVSSTRCSKAEILLKYIGTRNKIGNVFGRQNIRSKRQMFVFLGVRS